MKNRSEIIRFLKGAVCGAAITGVIVIGIANFDTEKAFFEPLPMTVSEKAATIAAMLEENYIGDFENSDLKDTMYSAMADSMGDPYTVYLTEKQMQAFVQNSDGTICGIGIVISQDKESGNCKIREVLENSPAEKAGIKAGDILKAIDGVNVEGKSVIDISSLTKGQKGTKIKITVERNGTDLDFEAERSNIDMQYVKSRVDGDIGYIKITEFSKLTAKQFKKAIEELKAQNIKGLIIDLRDNPGGMIDIVTEIADDLLPEGIITYTVDKKGNRNDFVSSAGELDMPIAVLVNGGSASASELLAGALQDYGKGVIVGTQTFGKGIVQGLYSLGDGSGIKITIQKYYTPNGVCIQGVGITPDYEVENSDQNDAQYSKALEILKNKIS
ncbi:MAG: S41 family peptidase [Candidatus Metalachnospira sp.]|nr:S41 family peptidase [Candidatus Metalachnospira sp.]